MSPPLLVSLFSQPSAAASALAEPNQPLWFLHLLAVSDGAKHHSLLSLFSPTTRPPCPINKQKLPDLFTSFLNQTSPCSDRTLRFDGPPDPKPPSSSSEHQTGRRPLHKSSMDNITS
ncbi:hypothetical protein HAX54_004166 [Datura stramonium]|uniref:Uncharacterized protein n=1 Tax=Datura stramonium TaxID=4076 RepID=A0ABS8RTN5_DATST|nr:hypothetical protein [Datura stramonium]